MTDNLRPAEQDNDPIVAEVHAARQKLLEQYGGIEGYLRHVRELDAQRHARERDLAEQREAEEAGTRITNVHCTDDCVVVDLADGRTISVPLAFYPRLLHATPHQRSNWQLASGGYGIHWPDIDEDLSAEGLLRGAAQASTSVATRMPGKRVKRTRYIQTAKLIVAVDTEMVIPPSDPSEPCREPETVALLRDIRQHAEAGDIPWLQSRGKVYQLIEATS